MTTPQLTQHIVDELSPVLGPGEAASVARLVLEDLFGYRRHSHPRQLSQDEQILAWATINRLKAGEPVQYVTGIADFYGLQLRVTPDVLIPRPETEELVEWVLEEHPAHPPLRVLDLGTGSGCIPLALKARRPLWSCAGVDVSQDALAIARDNAQRLELDVDFLEQDLLAQPATRNPQLATRNSQPATRNSQPATRNPQLATRNPQPATCNLLISNPPYIPPSERGMMSPSTLAHEPELALFVPEDDPLLFYRRIAEAGLVWLVEGGKLYFETNEFNNEEVVELLTSLGFKEVGARRDLSGKWRMVRGVR